MAFLESLFKGGGRQVGLSAVLGTACQYIPGVDETLVVAANVLVTTAGSIAATVTCTYTDEGNTARTLTLSFTLVAGGSLTTAIASANGTVPYMGVPQMIRAKAGTTVSIQSAGTVTGSVYNLDGRILSLGA